MNPPEKRNNPVRERRIGTLSALKNHRPEFMTLCPACCMEYFLVRHPVTLHFSVVPPDSAVVTVLRADVADFNQAAEIDFAPREALLYPVGGAVQALQVFRFRELENAFQIGAFECGATFYLFKKSGFVRHGKEPFPVFSCPGLHLPVSVFPFPLFPGGKKERGNVSPVSETKQYNIPVSLPFQVRLGGCSVKRREKMKKEK